MASKDKDKETKAKGGLLSFVDLEDKKEEHTINKILGKRLIRIEDKKEDKNKRDNELLLRYSEEYKLSVRLFLDKGYVIEPKVFDRCCTLINEKYESVDKNIVNMIKQIVSPYINSAFDVIYLHSNSQSVLIHFVSDISEGVYSFDVQKTIDIAYGEMFKEYVAFHYARRHARKVS